MATWAFSGGAKLFTSSMGLHVTGSGELAEDLAADVRLLERGTPPPVNIHGAAWLDLDPANHWLVDRWCVHTAARHRESIDTSYVFDVRDVPPAALEILAEEREPAGCPH